MKRRLGVVVVTVLLMTLTSALIQPVALAGKDCFESLPDDEQHKIYAASQRLFTHGIWAADDWSGLDAPIHLPVTRAEFGTRLVMAMGWEREQLSVTIDHPFDDVAGSAWYAPYVTLLYQAGIVRGHQDGMFRPSEIIEYDHAKLMVARMLRAAPDPTLANVDEALLAAGVSPHRYCPESPQAYVFELITLLDRSLDASLGLRH